MLSPLSSLDWRGFLARPALPPPPPGVLEALRREPILITGAGGSIGSALAQRLGKLAPPKLLLLEASESNLHALERDWLAFQTENSVAANSATFLLGSVDDRALLEEIFALHAPRIVFHAAAFKHVPLMEEQPLAAIANNIFGTETLVHVAAAHGARVLLLSTDKAVESASVMGATKRVAEQIVLAADGTVLRLANVLASRDSVAVIFARQIARGEPVTITDLAARRYFLTLDEAIDLLLAAAAHPKAGTLLAPLLSTAHNIRDLAQFMARQLAPDRELAMVLTGSRPGDKMTEALYSAEDRISGAGYDGMVVVETTLPTAAQLAGRLTSLRTTLEARDLGEALSQLCALVPDYRPGPVVSALSRRQARQVCA